MASETNKLFDIKVKEISIVPKGKNKQKIFLRKEDGGNMPELDNDTLVKLNDIAKSELSKEAKEAFAEHVEKAEMSDQEKGVVKAAMKIFGKMGDKLGADKMKELAMKAGFGFKKEDKQPVKKEENPSPFKKEYSEIKKSISDMIHSDKKEAFDKLMKEVEVEPVAVYSDPEVARLAKENDEIRDQLRKEKSERLLKEKIAEAKDYPKLNTTAEKLGKILKGVEEDSLEKEDKKELIEILKSANECLTENDTLLKELGSSHGEATSSIDAKVEKLAKEYMDKDEKLTKEQAMQMVYENNQDLYKEYEKNKEVR